MAASDRIRRVRIVALVLGAAELALALLLSAGAFLFGSVLSEVTAENVPIVAAYVVLGPLGLLPLAILSHWRPELAARAILAGGASTFMLALHPWGLRHALPHLHVDVGQTFLVASFVRLVLGVTMVVIDGTDRRLREAVVVGALAAFVTYLPIDRVRTEEVEAPFRTLHPITFLAFGPDSRMIVAAGRPTMVGAAPVTLSVIDAETGGVKVLGENTSQHVFSADRRTFVTVGTQETLIWDPRRWRVTGHWPLATGAVAVSSRDIVAIAQANGVQLVNLARGGAHPFVRYESGSAWFAWSPDGGLLAIGPGAGGDVLLLDAATRDLGALRLPGDEDPAAGHFAADGRTLALRMSSGQSSRVVLVSVPEGREVRSIDEHVAWTSEWFSPDGRTLVTSRLEETTSPPRTQLLLREAATWEQRAVFAALMEYAWSPDGATLATLEPMVGGRQQQVVLRSAVDGARIVVLGTVDMLVTVVAFSPDGARVAVAGRIDFDQRFETGHVAVFQVPAR